MKNITPHILKKIKIYGLVFCLVLFGGILTGCEPKNLGTTGKVPIASEVSKPSDTQDLGTSDQVDGLGEGSKEEIDPPPEKGIYAFAHMEKKYFPSSVRRDIRLIENRKNMINFFYKNHLEFIADFERLVQGPDAETQIGTMKLAGVNNDEQEEQLIKLIETVQLLNEKLREEDKYANDVCLKQESSVNCD